jgi:hypothetical protein
MVHSPHYRNSTPPGGCDFNNEEQAKLDKYEKTRDPAGHRCAPLWHYISKTKLFGNFNHIYIMWMNF